MYLTNANHHLNRTPVSSRKGEVSELLEEIRSRNRHCELTIHRATLSRTGDGHQEHR
jgi:hypothetical protein